MNSIKTKSLVSYLHNLALNLPYHNNLSTVSEKKKGIVQDLFSERVFTKHQEIERCFQDSQTAERYSDEERVLPPVTVTYSSSDGRYLEATRDIEAGETIFWEPPLICAPKGGTGPTCLECFLVLPHSNWPVCHLCKAPKCSSCDRYGRHELECDIVARVFANENLENNLILVKKLNIILTPLRTYLAIQESPYIKEIVDALQSNASQRRLAPIGKFIEEYIVKFFQTQTNLDISSDFIHHVCGVFDTNAFDMSFGENKHARALLPLAALMNHSCIPNTHHWFLGGHCIVRASTPIKKGESVTNEYTQVLWGTKSRRNHLSLTKHFVCTCPRCQDPTELGTHVSSLICHNCKGTGLRLPAANSKELWICNSCGDKMSDSTAQKIIKVTTAVVSQAITMETPLLKIAMKNVSKMLGKQHYTYVELQLTFVNTVMKNLEKATDEDLSEVLSYIPPLMDVMNKVEPGYSRIRGILILNKLKATAELLRRTLDVEDLDSTSTSTFSNIGSLIASLEDLESEGEECEQILKWDSEIHEVEKVRLEIPKLIERWNLFSK